MTPRATQRLQFHKGFTFADAERLVPYFAGLGVSHLYASPITTARPGSMHGYDVTDPTRVNPELGGEDGLRRLVAAARAAGLGLIVDIVPNHMAVGHLNAWWLDVLRHGEASRYAAYFDIDWEASRKVLLPVLGRPLREALAAGEITLDRARGLVCYFDQRFPLADAAGAESLERLLERQHYRLASWRTANDEINWRRFFDINELVGLRMEHPPAFEDVHALIFRLYGEGLIDGVRIDHIDGLSDPAGYCAALRRRLDALAGARPRAYLVVEKILLRGETLPRDWDCDGTSGYDFMNEVNAMQHDARGERALDALWEAVSGRSADFAVEEQAARREMIARSFSAQVEACAAAFGRVAPAEEISHAALRRALVELLAHFPVYRTYGAAEHSSFVARAVAGAMTTAISSDRMVIDRLGAWLTAPNPDPVRARAITRFQQLSAPIAAKAVEDTAFYRYGRLLSRNDVGFDAARISDSAADFHANMQRRHADFPHAMLATATHDHKRGEDVRARLAVLSEHADEWAGRVPGWIAQCRRLQREADGAWLPRDADVAILLQMIVGAWPLGLGTQDEGGRAAFAERLAQWQEKALREAKLATDWAVANAPYESAARDLVTRLVARNEIPDLLGDIASFVERIAPAGAVNGLVQTLLKLTVPGVPDFYQGTELWDFSLVDPDNRRPVDFATRSAGLDDQPIEQRATNWRDGRVKQALIHRLLALRGARPELFAAGSYEPLPTRGKYADRIIAFARRLGSDALVVVAPRAAAHLLQRGSIMFDTGAWKDTEISVSDPALVRLFKGRADSIRVGQVLERLPFAILTR